MAIDKISLNNTPIKPIQTYENIQKGGKTQGAEGQQGGSFGDLFTQAISEVDMLQKDADNKIEGMVLGEGVTTHQAMIALEKADVAFQLMNNIRGKIVRAYEEIIRMQA